MVKVMLCVIKIFTTKVIRGQCNEHICKNWCSLILKKKIRKKTVILLSICFVLGDHVSKNNNELSHMAGVLSNIYLSNLTYHSKSKFPFHNKICQSNLTYCSNFKVPILGEICQSNLAHNYNFKVPVLIKIYQSNLKLFPTTRYYTSISYVNSTFHIVLTSRQPGFALKWFMIGRQESEYQEVFVCLSGD